MALVELVYGCNVLPSLLSHRNADRECARISQGCETWAKSFCVVPEKMNQSSDTLLVWQNNHQRVVVTLGEGSKSAFCLFQANTFSKPSQSTMYERTDHKTDKGSLF